MSTIRTILIVAAALLVRPCHVIADQHDESAIDFTRDVRPILSENCVYCHGPDAGTREAGLRLDTEDGALTILEPGDREASELMDRLMSDDPDYKMPPPNSNRSVSAQQIQQIGQWIHDGAKWERHWSFRPIVTPPVPVVTAVDTSERRIQHPIDAFIQQKLVDSKLSAAPLADRRTLIRRLSLDLTGLPPTAKQVEQFVNDTQDDAYDELVQRLLESPAYGQRMAWNWLDAARYSDTNGYQGDRERTMYPWRDWVVQAFNDNMPYDQFTIWQLAGDQLPEATDEQKLATGFLRNHMINGEGGRIAEENRVEYVMDMSETVGTVWLGLTLNCCRCHDHKYDPISNEEYYQFFAFFNQTPVKGNGGDPQMAPNLATPSAKQSEHLASLAGRLSELDDRLVQQSKRLVAEQSQWEKEQTNVLDLASWKILHPIKAFAVGQRTRVLGDQSVLTSGNPPANDTYTVIAQPELKTVSGLRIEALRHDSMTGGGLAQSGSSNFVLTGVKVSLIDGGEEAEGQDASNAGQKSQRREIKIVAGEATFEQKHHTIEKAFDSDNRSGWAVHQGKIVDRDHAAAFTFEQPIEIEEGQRIEIVLEQISIHEKHNIGRFRLSMTNAKRPKLGMADAKLVAALQTPAEERSAEQTKLIAKTYRESNPEYQAIKKQRDGVIKERTEYQKQIAKVMVMQDMDTPRETFVLERGLYSKPTDKVNRKFPDFLPSNWSADTKPEDAAAKTGTSNRSEPNRLDYARWLVNDEHPLTARVTVNRLWQQFFGIGLVKTTEDFGRQGEIPIHRELLDWLSADFRESGWDVKELIRKIVTSHAYRQSSKMTAAAYEIDPLNRLMARGARFRMPSWMLRDQALAISGLMSGESGGPSVNSYQPPGVWEEASFGKKTYQRDSGEKLYRRSLYTFWRRIIAPTMFFDTASRQTCTVKTSRTNTPLHALQTLNNTQFVESARVLAEFALHADVGESNAASDRDVDTNRINVIFERALARPASAKEIAVLTAGLDRTRGQYADDESAAAKLLSVGESVRDHELDSREHAAWTALCLAVLNFDETLTRE
ncbi:PSD1 and planctomycete cytochrome C domain-containing protein [Stieleria marina]|uniref:PSD1 and planctomycete cytochrome C domain-containing protein n=1 Tax=Stieleria marina TaxID=1930275 RepID=UPI003AF3EC7C